METIDDVQDEWPQWWIEDRGTVYVAHPIAELKKPPVWEWEQMVRGLMNRIVAEDLGELARQIGLQHKLREQLADEGEAPYDGRTYVEIERAGDGISLA